MFNISVLNRRNELVPEASWQYRGDRLLPAKENIAFTRLIRLKPSEYANRQVLSLLSGGGGNENYFHWMFDVLPRWHLFKSLEAFDDMNVSYLMPNPKHDFQRDSIAYLGIDESKQIHSEGQIHIRVSEGNIFTTQHPRHGNESGCPRWIIDFLRESFLPLVEPFSPSKHSKRIYISRAKASRRRIINESEFVSRLKPMGFKIVSLEDKSLEEQVNLFNHAQIIISPHGAALANLAFCKEGVKLIEIFPKGCIIPLYSEIAKRAKIYYHLVEGLPHEGSNKKKLNSDFEVNCNDVFNHIEASN